MCLIPLRRLWNLTCDYSRNAIRMTIHTTFNKTMHSLRKPPRPSRIRMDSYGVRGRLTAVALTCLAFGSACARPGGSQHTGTNLPANDQAPPFHQNLALASERTLAIPQDSKPATALPFHAAQPCILPSGTFLTVKLGRSLVPAKVHSGDPFVASVTGRITVDGRTIINLGAEVIGRVESAQASSPQLSRADRSGQSTGKGYVQLTLTTIVVDGKQLPIQTSSLFARGTSPRSNVSSRGTDADVRSDVVRVQKGRRLTFRLTAPIALDEIPSVAVLDPAKE